MPRLSLRLLFFAVLLLPTASTGLTLTPGTLLGVEGFLLGDRITQYDPAGNVLGTLAVAPKTSHTGLVAIGAELFLLNNSPGELSKVDLDTGALTTLVLTGGVGDLGRYGDLILSVGTAPNTQVSFYDTDGVLQSVLAISISNPGPGTRQIEAIDGDVAGGRLFVGATDGEIAIFDLSGTLLGTFDPGFGGLTGLTFDPETDSIWASYGLGDELIRELDLSGNVLASFGTLDLNTTGITFVTPEPSTGLLLGSGMLLLAASRRTRPRCSPGARIEIAA